VILLNKKRFNNSVYSFFNHTILNQLAPKSKKLFWTYESGYSLDSINFEKIKFPLIVDISTDIGHTKNELYLGNEFYRLDYLRSCGSNYSANSFQIKTHKYKFDKAVFHNYYNFRISFIVSSSFKENIKNSYVGNAAQFPPEWKHLFCFRGYHENDIVLNENSTHFKQFNQPDFLFAKNLFQSMESLNGSEGSEILKNKKKSFCFILYLISLNEKSYWDGLIINNPDFVKKLWVKMFGNEDEEIYFFHDGLNDTQLIVISSKKWTIIKNIDEIKKVLPVPSNQWHIKNKELSKSAQKIKTST
jgi:hypothetical protein